MRLFKIFTLFCLFIPWMSASCWAGDIGDEGKTRSFRLNYGATVDSIPPGATVRIWVPIAKNNRQQEVRIVSKQINAPLEIREEKKYGNKIGYFELSSDQLSQVKFSISYDVVRKEAKVEGTKDVLSKKQKQLFLSANSLVPVDGKPVDLLGETELPTDQMQAGRAIYDVVEKHMKYDKSNPGYGKGDSVWACDSRTGNCTDFHSLFISLSRSQSIPARFEIGFPLPADKQAGEIGGYHCWAWFNAKDHGWSPVDISEADKNPEMKEYYFGHLTADRVAFSTGRDIELVPKSSSGPLNYFIYPHVEVDGKVWPKEKIKLDFSFANKTDSQSNAGSK